MIIFKATEGSEEEYKRLQKTGGQQMMKINEILLPGGMQMNSKEEEEEKKWQEEADKAGVLLPTQFNRSRTSTQAQDEEILMPCGF